MRKTLGIMIAILFIATVIGQAQDLAKTDTYLVKELSRTDFSIFTTAYFTEGWFPLVDSWSFWTPSQNAFLKDNAEDGRGLGNTSPKRAFVGSSWLNK